MSCGSPLEHAPERRTPGRPAQGRNAWSIWLALCLALGAALGLAAVRSLPAGRAPYLLGLVLGGLCGGVLGILPGPGAKLLRRCFATCSYCLLGCLASRRLSRISAACEQALESGNGDHETRVRLAAALWLQDAHSRAEQVLLQSLETLEASAVARHNAAVVLAIAGRGARALEEFERVRLRMSESATLWWNIGLARLSLGQLAAAAEAFQELARQEPGNLSAHNALALVLARQGRLDDAVSEMEAALAMRRRHPDVLCNLGIIHQSRGDLEVAARCFTGALQSEPAHVPARYNRGLCLALRGWYHAALDDFSALARVAPEHPWASIQRAICWHRVRQTRRAIESARRAARLAPGDFQVRYNAGTLLLRENLIEQATTELERAYELDSNSIDVILNLGVAVHLSGRLRQALDHFRAAVRLNPRHALARYNSVVAYCTLDMLPEAELEIDALLGLYAGSPEALNAIGVVRLLQNRLSEAAEQFRRVADAMPRSAIARANLALAYYLQGDIAAAAEQAGYALGLDPQLAAAHDIAGHAALEIKDLPRAIEHFRALVRLEPSNPDAHANLGLAYYRDERLNEAIECYKHVLVFAPKSPEGHNDLGLAYAKNKMLEEAARHLKQVLEWRPDSPVVHSNLGLVYYFKGDTEDAVHEWREVTRLSPAYARMREATRFSAYDDQQMVARPIDPRGRVTHFPLKVAAFRHSFQIALDQDGYQLALPWPDLAVAARWRERARKARAAMLRP